MRPFGVLVMAVLLTAHVGSPNVFFTGKAGAYDITVVVRPPEVVPGIALVTVRAPATVTGVSIRPVYWRAGAKGAPSADALKPGSAGTYEGSLWLMARGAYSVDVAIDGPSGIGTVTVPVPSVATGRLELEGPLAATLAVLGLFLVTGLVNIVRKAAGEGLLEPGKALSESGVRITRIAGVASLAVIALAVFGGAKWWGAVDNDYQSTIYQASPLSVSLANGMLRVAASDTQFLPGGRASGYVPDHGKLMHLFLVSPRGFAHLHPRPDTAHIPSFTAALPQLPPGAYRIYGDVVQETGFERTMVGTVDIPDSLPRLARTDPDDAWFVGVASPANSMELPDGSFLKLTPAAVPPKAGEEISLNIAVTDATGTPLSVEPYLGMAAHAVVVRTDGEVYVHLHPMGSVTAAAQDVFAARNRGDTTASGALSLASMHSTMAGMSATAPVSSATSFPYAFPKPGDYRLFVQVKRNGRVLTGAFAIKVGDAPAAAK